MNPAESLGGLRVIDGHVDQGAVGENDEGRHAGHVGQFLSPGPQQLE